jgi:hypothetical protein
MISLLDLDPAAENLSGPDRQRADLLVDNIDVLVEADVLVGEGGEEVVDTFLLGGLLKEELPDQGGSGSSIFSSRRAWRRERWCAAP